MPLLIENDEIKRWEVRHIGVIGAGVVGVPMAAVLAQARIRLGSADPAKVTLVQRLSPTSGWKVEAINSGQSPLGGEEPELERMIEVAVREGLLSATHDIERLWDADVVLVCVQTDRKGFAPDYGPLFAALDSLTPVLRKRPKENIPLIIFESTLAPSSMLTVIRDRFSAAGLMDGRDCLLANSPNRVMPGRLVERIICADKLVAGTTPLAVEAISRLYSWVVTRAALHATNSMTAEVVKTVENAYRDVRIAYVSEVARFCDKHDIDFFALRDEVNRIIGQSDGASGDAVPVGGLLVPTVGVGGHCLPKDGYLLWWRLLESRVSAAQSLILQARSINDESPGYVVSIAEKMLGDLSGLSATVLGVAYRADSADTRNSPSLVLASLLRDRGVQVTLHDPYVRPGDVNLVRSGFGLAQDFERAVYNADLIFVCVPHRKYREKKKTIFSGTRRLRALIDGCNFFSPQDLAGRRVIFGGIGKGRKRPEEAFVKFVADGFRVLEGAFAREVKQIVDFLNSRYAASPFHRVSFEEVRRLAGTCVTGCRIVDPDTAPKSLTPYAGFLPRLLRCVI